ncbi:ZIP family zinc transporter/zinc and cadmium transporter [Scopulibacillus darangshiensis]|uniref:ZIP family zinc transporter/zinc and cadmium transporter n=1 Tax=Scopulibacillus darangshiensis TaxID=442528 RepID=A0A4V2SNI0_9BACL|nr:ZIP family metal transporter [Scopulibacillus darangshiensis]TCP31296.1 ZIP family zinc transporter/zinc and cadmium transporter [Scopulibacillus darangshiensis]
MEAILFALLAAFANILGGLIIFIKKDWSRRGLLGLMALSSGLLIALTVLDLLPEVVPSHPWSPAFILLGILCIFFFQQFVATHFHFGEEVHHTDHSNSTVIGAFGGMMIHTFFDGFSIVASFEVSIKLGITVMIAVLLHKIPDGLTISSIVFSSSKDKKKALWSTLGLGMSTIVGAFAALLINQFSLPQEDITTLALSFSAGIFLYVAGTDLLPVVNASDDRPVASLFFLGIVLFFILQFIIKAIAPGLA